MTHRGKNKKGLWIKGYYVFETDTMLCCATEEEQKAIEHHYIQFDGMCDWNLERPHHKEEINPDTLCKFTGEYDINRTPIFTKDIVKVTLSNETKTYVKTLEVTQSLKGTIPWCLSDNILKIEIIGNTIDNPDLLDVQNYRRLFIMRKDLNMSPGKLAAQVGHCAEAYWMSLLKENSVYTTYGDSYKTVCKISKDIYDKYVNGSFVKVICEAKTKTHLLKVLKKSKELGLIEGKDYGLIYDNCATELTPEEPNGTTLTGIWFAPMANSISKELSKGYQLYK